MTKKATGLQSLFKNYYLRINLIFLAFYSLKMLVGGTTPPVLFASKNTKIS